MHNTKEFIVSSFYKFVYLSSPEKIIKSLKRSFFKFNIKGTFIVGNEGINGSFSVNKKQFNDVSQVIQDLVSKKLKFKSQQTSCHSFLRLKIKLKKEIVTLGKKNVNPIEVSGQYLDANSWDSLLLNNDSIILDTRNSYESDIGTFKSSLKTETKNFRDFPQWIKNNRNRLKNKKIAMFCTGGIRCEKASNYLINLGYKNVYQLHGGIIDYLKKTKNKNKMWQGECFVFDERITLNEKLEQGKYSQCFACRSPITKEEKKSKHYKPGVSCPKCCDTKTPKQIKKYEERQKQISISKQKGIKHLGS